MCKGDLDSEDWSTFKDYLYHRCGHRGRGLVVFVIRAIQVPV